MKKIGAHSFLLLEMLIALTLVTLCIMPFIKIPSRAVQEELHSIERLELQHISDRACAHIKERIYTQDISWEQICHTWRKKAIVLEQEVILPFKELIDKKCVMRCELYSTGKKDDKQQEHRLVTVHVRFERPNSISRGKFISFSNEKKNVVRFTYQFIVKSVAKAIVPQAVSTSSQAPR